MEAERKEINNEVTKGMNSQEVLKELHAQARSERTKADWDAMEEARKLSIKSQKTG
jgi:uncharacterized protein (DUF3084 family)